MMKGQRVRRVVIKRMLPEQSFAFFGSFWFMLAERMSFSDFRTLDGMARLKLHDTRCLE
jgi:hypothetical protein